MGLPINSIWHVLCRTFEALFADLLRNQNCVHCLSFEVITRPGRENRRFVDERKIILEIILPLQL